MGDKKSTPVHQALYRKYRSKSLDEIVGQEHITRTLANAIKQGKINHAYLFTGPRGVGKTSIARIVAHEINGLPYDNQQPHLDIIEIDAASNRRIDDIRDLRDKVHIAPISAKYKVYIIDEVHMLTTESFNALLKTLEEPPAHVVFILATTEVHKLPATIISRTQRHSFKAASHDDIVKHLKMIAQKEGITIDNKALGLIAEHGDGSFRDSVSLLDQVAMADKKITAQDIELLFGLAPQATLEQLLNAVYDGDHPETIQLIEELLTSGLTPSGVAEQLLKVLRRRVAQNKADEITLTLMQQLLQVGAAHFAKLKLETTLLAVRPSQPATARSLKKTTSDTLTAVTKSSAKAQSPQVSATLPEPPEPAPQPQKNDTAEEPKSSKSAETPLQPGDPAHVESWPQILEAIKQKNGPLYTILRLAMPQFSAEGLTLAFRFPFHQKRVEDSKHKAIVAEATLEITGQNYVITTIVDSQLALSDTPAPAEDSAHASLINTVQDIMGGGEIVNV